MGKVKDEKLFTLIRNYLLVYLPTQRKASNNTVETYRYAINQFIRYAADKKKISILAVTSDMFNAEMVNGYLDSISGEKKLSAATRNNRLAALKAFLAYASACYPEYISLCSELSAIKVQKRDRFAGVDYMSEKAVKAMFNEPDTSTEIGLRDQFLMIFLYDTGARIHEVLGVRLCDLKLDETPTVKLFGKGRKARMVPLMDDTVKHLRNYLSVFHPNVPLQSEDLLFYIQRRDFRKPLDADTVRARLQKYADSARVKCPEVPERMYPHLWRHTRAMHLYQHGMDLTLISQWLGHSSVDTTLVYAHADTEAKRKAIEKAMTKDNPEPEEEWEPTISDEELLKRLYGL